MTTETVCTDNTTVPHSVVLYDDKLFEKPGAGGCLNKQQSRLTKRREIIAPNHSRFSKLPDGEKGPEADKLVELLANVHHVWYIKRHPGPDYDWVVVTKKEAREKLMMSMRDYRKPLPNKHKKKNSARGGTTKKILQKKVSRPRARATKGQKNINTTLARGRTSAAVGRTTKILQTRTTKILHSSSSLHDNDKKKELSSATAEDDITDCDTLAGTASPPPISTKIFHQVSPASLDTSETMAEPDTNHFLVEEDPEGTGVIPTVPSAMKIFPLDVSCTLQELSSFFEYPSLFTASEEDDDDTMHHASFTSQKNELDSVLPRYLGNDPYPIGNFSLFPQGSTLL